jgi:tetratricopeptide (TPR) repeat protein
VKIHPSDLMIEDFLSLRKGETGTLLLRHLATCPLCQARLAHLPLATSLLTGVVHGSAGSNIVAPSQPAIQQAAAADYSSAIDKSELHYLERAHVLQQERAEAPALFGELLAVQSEKRKLILANASRFKTWGVYELLLERSWELRASRKESEELAWLAIELSAHLDATYYHPQLIEDLRARAWSYIANIRRLAADLVGAEEAFARAYVHLKSGTREPLERAQFLDLKASLRAAQRRFHEAIRLLRRSANIFLAHGEKHRAGKSLLNLAATYNFASEPAAAIIALQDSLRLIDPAQDERLLLAALHNLIDILTHMGRFIEARGLYGKARPLYRKFNDPYFDNRRLWIKARIERGLGQRQSAEELFVAVRERFLAEDLPYEAALVSLELALLYAEQDRIVELKRLATEILPIFTALQIHREALAALMFLKQAVDSERLSVEVVTGIAEFLHRAEADPSLKLETPG